MRKLFHEPVAQFEFQTLSIIRPVNYFRKGIPHFGNYHVHRFEISVRPTEGNSMGKLFLAKYDRFYNIFDRAE